MKTIIIDDVFEFDKIGEGAEGEVFKIDDDTVYKYLKHRKTREDKIKKIKYLKNIDLEKFVQIKDIVSDGYIEIGYTMKLVKTNSFINVKKALNDEISLNEKIEYIKDIENTIKEAHNKGIVLVDMFYHNFLINENNKVIGIDIDNFQINGFKNNFKPVYFLKYYNNKINNDVITKDLDIVSNVLFMLHKISMPSFDMGRVNNYVQGDKIIEEYIKKLNISKELCELLTEIVSDSENKPYLGNYIDELKSDSEFIYFKKR